MRGRARASSRATRCELPAAPLDRLRRAQVATPMRRSRSGAKPRARRLLEDLGELEEVGRAGRAA